MRAAKISYRLFLLFMLIAFLMHTGLNSAFAQKGAANQTQAVNTLTITYQGRLTDTNGNAVVDGDHTLTFKLYDQPTSGSALWQETQNLTTSNGVFTTRLGSNSSLDALSFDKIYYLGIIVDGGNELSPRTALSTVPYAQRAHTVDDSVFTVDKIDGAGASKGQVLKWDGSQWVPSADEVGSASGSNWNLSGNSGTTPGDDFLGTADDKALVLKVNQQQAVRIIPEDTTSSMNIGNPSNFIADGIEGAIVAGGYGNKSNTVSRSWAAVLGGRSNRASGKGAVVVAGMNNEASGQLSTIGGGSKNTASDYTSTVSGGTGNTAEGLQAFVGGGNANTATGWRSAIAGGNYNETKGNSAFVGAGDRNYANGLYAMIPGGQKNAARGASSFAAGQQAKANDDNSFVWSDGATDSVYTTGARQFLIHADGGVGIGTNNPDAQLTVASQNHWDLANSEGDFKIGNDQYRLKIGLATGGGGAGSVNMWAEGGTGKLSLGSNGSNVVSIQQDDGIYPASDNTYSLGTSTNRWSAVYSANGTIQTSDRRLKTGIQPLSYGLEDILKLKPVSYRWKKSSGLHQDDGQTHLGLIAQEVQQVIREVVDAPEGKQKYYGMNYTALVPVLIKAVQQQEQQIKQLRAIHESDQKRLSRLESRMKALMAALENRDKTAAETKAQPSK